MDIQKIVEVITYVEKNYAVDEWEIDGIPLWPFIRIENYYLLSLLSLNNSAEHNASSNSYIKQIIESKKNLRNVKKTDHQHEAILQKSDVLFLGDGISFSKLNGLWYQKFCDPIADELKKEGVSSLRLELSHNFLAPRYSSSFFIQSQVDNVIIRTMIKNKIIKPKFKNEKWADYQKFTEDAFVKEHFLKLPSKEGIRLKIGKIKALIKYYQKLLKKIQPKIAYIGAYYGDQQLAFILACREMGIVTVDSQHGVQGEFHLAYGNWHKVPAKGFGPLPDYFAVWSEEEKSAIEAWNTTIENHKVLISGNLFADIWKEDKSPVVLDYDKKVTALKRNAEQATILLTLSPYTDKEMKIIYSVIQKTQKDYNWLIRLHPAMVKQKDKIKEEIANNGINHYELDGASDFPLYSVLRNIDLHLTVQSSCVIESADFGVKSIITSNYGKILYLNVIQAGNAVFQEKEEGILNALHLAKESKQRSINHESRLKDVIEFTKSVL